MRTAAAGLVVALVGAAAIWGALLVPPAPEGETWAGIVPMTAAVAVLIAGLWMAVPALRTPAGETVDRLPGSSRGVLGVLGLVLLSLLYQQSVVLFGYLLPTAVAAPIALMAFGVRSPAGLASSVVLCPLTFHVVFFELLGVFPPYGELFDPLDMILG